jgi:hypothetical protein
MLRARLIASLVLDEFIVDNTDAVTREYSQDLAVALALFNHCPARCLAGIGGNLRSQYANHTYPSFNPDFRAEWFGVFYSMLKDLSRNLDFVRPSQEVMIRHLRMAGCWMAEFVSSTVCGDFYVQQHRPIWRATANLVM